MLWLLPSARDTHNTRRHVAASTLGRLAHEMQELVNLVLKPELNEHYSLQINTLHLCNFDICLVQTLLAHPYNALPAFDRAAVEAQQKVVQQHQSPKCVTVKGLVHVRVHGLTFYLDGTAALLFPGIGSIRSCHVDKLITVSGTVVRTGSITMLESHKMFECTRCHDR